MPASWNTPVSEEPPTIAVAIDRESFTLKCLEHVGEAIINIPSSEHADLVYHLGTVSGEEVDKVREYGVKLDRLKDAGIPYWIDAIGVMEVKVKEKIDVGEVRLYLFEVLRAYAKGTLYSKWGWNLTKTSTLLHGAGRAFYAVGKRVLAKKTH